MAAMSYLCPEFIEEGRLCWLRAPLYIVEKKNGTAEYYFTDEEFDKVKNKVSGEIHRNKGLGEMDADQARESMFTEKYQRLDVLEYDESAMNLLSQLMGSRPEPRKDFIFENVDFSKITE